MSHFIAPHKTGLAIGGLFGLIHLCWSLMILVGLAQPFMDWIFDLHMIQPPYFVMPFSLTSAIILIIITSVIGYIAGFIFGWIWNLLHKEA